jgi:hypothetical protein
VQDGPLMHKIERLREIEKAVLDLGSMSGRLGKAPRKSRKFMSCDWSGKTARRLVINQAERFRRPCGGDY